MSAGLQARLDSLAQEAPYLSGKSRLQKALLSIYMHDRPVSIVRCALSHDGVCLHIM